METAIENGFFAAAARLPNQERGRVMGFIDKFLENPKQPGLSLERLQRTNNEHLWSARVTDDLRAILYRKGEQTTLLHVGRHDEAYQWAERYRAERHPYTGLLQVIPAAPPVVVAQTTPRARQLFATHADEYLLSLGVPLNWLPALRQVTNEDELLQAIEKLPADVAERLLDVAAGKLVTPPAPVAIEATLATQQAAAQNLFVVKSKDELGFLLEAPLAQWIAFLHPSQKRLAYGAFNGAVKVTGSAGTGKTVVALHRARHLAAQGQRVLVTSYVQTLCRNLERNLQLFCTPEELRRITVTHVHKLAADLLQAAGESWQPVSDDELSELLQRAAVATACPLTGETLLAEWQHIIEAQNITTWEQYRSASRAGRGRALTLKDRKAVWDALGPVQQQLAARRQTTYAGLCLRALALVRTGRIQPAFDAVVVDEVQDLRAPELSLLAALAPPANLMLVGDGGQRIYSGKVTLKTLGIDVRGRSHVLRLNYRTTEQIRRFADALLDADADDLDGGREERTATRSLLAGPVPQCTGFATRAEQADAVAARIGELLQAGRTPDEIAVFARQARLLEMLETRLRRAAIPHYRLSKEEFPHEPAVNLGTMHRAKGLEFKVVFVLDADDETLPPAGPLRKKTDEQLRAEFLEQERHLLYVSVTRARDAVFISWAGQPSRFLPAAT